MSLTQFLAANTGLNLKTADLFSPEALAQYNWPTGADQKQLLQQLRTRQRMLKVYPDENVAAALEGLGFHSAHHIASLPADDFAQKAVPALSGITGISDPAALCATITDNASRIRRQSMELALAQPRTMELAVTTPGSVQNSNPDFQEGIPDYQRLFGPMLTCDCDDCQSIFGPAAYFTDLMRVVTTYITKPQTDDFELKNRRPDLWTLPLNCNTATTEVAYLDIVNTILKQNIQTNYTSGTDPMQTIAKANYPFNAPYNEPLETIRYGLKELGSGLPQVYKLMNALAPATSAAALHLSPEQLTLVKDTTAGDLYQRYGFYSNPTDISKTLSDQQTFLQQTGLQPEELEQLVFQNLKQGNDGYAFYDNGSRDIWTTSFSDQLLTQSITIECWIYPTATYPTMAVIGKNMNNEFYVYLNSDMKINCQYGNGQAILQNIVSQQAVQLNTWTHIAWTRNLTTGENKIYINGVRNVTYTDTTKTAATVSNSSISIGYVGTPDTSYHGAISELRLWTIARTGAQIRSMMYARQKDYTEAGLYAYWPMNETSGNVANDLCSHHYNATRGDSIYFTLYDSLPLGTVTEINPTVAHGFYLNSVLASGQYMTLTGPAYVAKTISAKGTYTPAGIFTTDGTVNYDLSTAALNQLAMFIRLQKQTNWQFDELDWTLKSIAGTQTTLTNTVIESLGKVMALKEAYNIPLEELTTLWYDLKTYGRGNGTVPQDFWDRVFNSPPMMTDAGASGVGAYYRPVYAGNPLFSSTVTSWSFNSPLNAQDQRVSNLLASALDVSSADLAAIVSAVAGTQLSMMLTVQNMSLLYRMARFAKMLQLAVPDFISLLRVSNLLLILPSASKDVTISWTLAQVETICENAAWFKKSKLRMDQLVYLTTVNAPTTQLRLPDPEQTATAFAAMINSSAPYLITPESFVSDRIDSDSADAIYQQLLATHYINTGGLVLNGYALTTEAIYTALTSDTQVSDIIYAKNPQPEVVSFLSSTAGTCQFNFDPFADADIQKNNSFTISFWVCVPDTESAGWPRMMGNVQPNGGNEQKSPSFTQNQNVNHSIQISYGYSGVYYTATANVFEHANKWVYLAWVNDNGHWTLYRNGVAVEFTSQPANAPAGIFKQTVTDPTYFISTSFTGYITSAAIWNTAHPAETVQQLMLKGPDAAAKDLVAWWPMNEGKDLTIANKSANPAAVNGTLTGGATWHSSKSFGLTLIAASVCNTLQTAQDAQNALVIKTLAPLAGVSTSVMTGICTLTGNEINNATAVGVSSGNVPYAPNMLLIPDNTSDSVRTTYLQQLQRNGALARWFKLSGEEVAGISAYSAKFGTGSFTYGKTTFTIAQLMELSFYKSVQLLCNDPEGLITYFKDAPLRTDPHPNTPTTTQLNLLASLTGWNETELNTIVNEPYFNTINFNTATGLRKIADVMAMEELLGMGIVTLNLLRNVAGYSASDNGNWQAYHDAAAAVKGALQVKKGTAAVDKVNNIISTQERDTLCSWLIWELSETISGVTNRNELYEYLLIDVNMSPDVKTSWTVAAMNSLQLYVNRCINSLEPEVTNNIPEAWWKWMSTYRVWQANREVYLYPENYVDPSLRKLQSPEFEKFIGDISKGQITDENVKQALATYLESVNEVSNLKLIDGYIDPVFNLAEGSVQDNRKLAVYLIARSRTEPADFYTRTGVIVTSNVAVHNGVLPDEASNVLFGAWTKINLKINSKLLTTVVAFGRQFVFWVEQTKITNTDDNDKKYNTIYGTIYYSCRNFNEAWEAPVVLKENIIISVYGKSLPNVNYYEEYLAGADIGDTATHKQYSFYKEDEWNSVRLQYLPPSSTTEESILITLGDMVICGPNVGNTKPPSPTVTNMPDEQVVFQNQLYNAATYAFSNKTHYTTIINGVQLFSSLTQRDVIPEINTSNAQFLRGRVDHLNSSSQLSFYLSASLLTCTAPEPGSWWPLVQNFNLTNTTSADDIISENNLTTSNVTTWTEGVFPGMPNAAIPSMLSNSSFTCNWDNNVADTEFTWAFWINASSVSSGDILHLPIPTSSTQVRFYKCYFSSNYINFLYYNKSTSISRTYFSILPNTWYFVNVTVSGSGLKVYLNGVRPTQTNNSSGSSSGSYTSMSFGGFTGKAFGLQYWKQELSQSQITELYNENLAAPYLFGLHKHSTSLYRLGNSAGSFAFNTGSQSYLVLPDITTSVKTISECLRVTYYENSSMLQVTFSHTPLGANTPPPLMKFLRINTDTIPFLISGLARGGVKTLFEPEMQYLPEKSLGDYFPSSLVRLPETDTMSFNGASSIYFWELFFYTPYLIAEKLRTGRRFDEAEKWYQYIFDPSSPAPTAADKWYDFLLNPASTTAPVAFWPLNKETDNQFNSLKGNMPATATNLSGTDGVRVPFSFLNRSVQAFSATAASYASVDYTSDLNPPLFTITAWVKLTQAPLSSQNSTIVVSQYRNNGYRLSFKLISEGIWVLNCTIWASLNGADATWVSAFSGNLSSLNEWLFVAGRYDGKSLKVYINGEDVTQTGGTVNGFVKNASERNLLIGAGDSVNDTTCFFNGFIADVAIYGYGMKGSALKRMYQNYIAVGPNAAFWKFAPFQRINAESLFHILNGSTWDENFLQPAEYYTASLQMAVYEYDPFDPDTLARLRVNSWQKATFMRYVENLLNWGDSLFTQDTWETLTDASMRYVLAATLLGRMPVKNIVEEPKAVQNYTSIEQEYSPANVPPFLIEMENGLSGLTADAYLPQQVQSIVDAYFCIPANKQLLNYWKIVEDRLYKLRHGLTITGAPNNIPLFAPPVDPAALVKAAASGAGVSTSVTSVPAVPPFRFSVMIAQAKNVTSEVTRLGSELLAALEKRDAEYLARLQAGYQVVLANLNAKIKASQINQLQYVGEGLQASYDNAQYMHNTYRDWMLVPIGPLEALSLFFAADAAIGQQIATDIRALAVPAYLLPDIFGLADGGMSPGDSVNAASSIVEGDAHVMGAVSQLMTQMGQYVRRELEWDLQKNIAGNQMKEIQAQITANNFALEAAYGEATLNQTQLEQSQEVYDFLKTKFTNEELYEWMSGQLSTLYFQMFQLAWSLAQSAQTALQYELNLNQSYLNNATWNASYQGLLAGDALSLALQQMENAYISGNNRKLEIRKTWSMRQNNPQALLTLVSTGNCRFDINELSYDLDFPGHYNRKIKSLSVTIPAVVGPYQNIHASLTQTGNTVVIKPSEGAVKYLLGMPNSSIPSDGSLRVNWNPNQEIIISTGVNDAGMFQVNFNDDQYLPFEGTGAVSSWNLSIPQAANAFDLRSISDVIITVEYTAEDGGATFRSQVTALPPVQNYSGWQYLSMRQMFGAAWFNFCTNPSNNQYNLSFELVKQMYPANLSDVQLGNSHGETGVFFVTADDISLTGMHLSMNGETAVAWPLPDNLLYINSTQQPVAVPGKGNPWVLAATTVPDTILTEGKIDQTKLLDIILVMPFSGTLTW